MAVLGLAAVAITYLLSGFPDLIEKLDEEEGFEYD